MAFQAQLSAQAGELGEALTGASQKVRRRESMSLLYLVSPYRF